MSGAGAGGLVLECRPTREGGALVFPYTIRNASGVAAWVMEGLPSASGEAGDTSAPSFVALPDGDEVIIGKLLPPMPTDRKVLFPLAPLAVRLEPGAALESRLAVTLPIVECSAYLPDLPVREHAIAELSGIRLVVAAWPASLPGLAALPSAGRPELHRLAGPPLRALAHLAEARFPVRKLHMLRRLDAFGRDPTEAAG